MLPFFALAAKQCFVLLITCANQLAATHKKLSTCASETGWQYNAAR